MAPPPIDRTETLAPRESSPPDESERAFDAADDPGDLDADDPDRYAQVAEHGRGGLGRVVRAVDRRLGRTVAVKELLKRGEQAEARFVREAMITARLEHPGIVPVHEAGRWPNGDPYYVMKLVEGRTLKELICERGSLRERLVLLPHVIAIADAVGYAHSEGVIHRDLKPSNVIVGAFGETIVVDWGLARDRKRDVAEPSEELLLAHGSGCSTVSGKVVGTPAYMAPEQARGELCDERTDVYAIGALLYELLAGSPPHADETPQATLDRVIAGPPAPLPAVVAHLPTELGAIVSKAMSRAPCDRYPNATALAEDLRRFQAGKLVSAHAYTTWSILWKKIAQYRGVVAVAVASTVALGVLGVESFHRVVAERNNANDQRRIAQDALDTTVARKRELILLQAETSLRKDPTAAIAWLKQYGIADGDRATVIDVIDEAVALGVARHVFRPNEWVYDAQFTPDGGTLVTAVRDKTVRAYDLATEAETVLGRSQNALDLVAISPDGSIAVTSDHLGEVWAWPLEKGEPRQLAASLDNRTVMAMRFSPDGARLLVQRMPGAYEVIDLAGATAMRPASLAGAVMWSVAMDDWSRSVVTTSANQVSAMDAGVLRPLGKTDKAITGIAISPSGKRVLVHDGEQLWSVPFAGGPLVSLAHYPASIRDISWSPDERQIAVCGDRTDVLIVDATSGEARELRGHTDAIYSVAWSRDGKRLLSASDDATARVWTVADGSSLVLRGHDDDVYRAHFSPDEHQVVTASLDGTARVWTIPQPSTAVLAEQGAVERMSVDGDSALVKTPTTVARWNLANGTRTQLFSWAEERSSFGSPIASRDGEELMVPGPSWSMEVRRRGGSTVTLRGHREKVSRAEFSRDGRALYSSSFDGTVRRWDLATGTGATLLALDGPVRRIAVGGDGRALAFGGDETYLLPAGGGEPKRLGKGRPWCVWSAEFEAVRDRPILHRCDASLAVLDGDRVVELATDGYSTVKVAVSADGKRFAGAMDDRTVRIWEAQTGKLVNVLRGHSDLVEDLAFSPDGEQLASASYDKTVRIWQLRSGRHRVLRGHSGAVDSVAWRDARHLVTGSRDGTLREWDVPALELPTTAQLNDELNEATTARIELDRPTSGSPSARS